MRTVLLATAVLCAALASGCGYRAGFLIPADIKTVHIRMTDNETFWREAKKVDNLVGTPAETQTGPLPPYTMEVEFAERLKTEVIRRTPLKVVDEENADSVLITSITYVHPRVLMRDANDDVLSERVDIRVSFIWRDRRSGRVIASSKGVSRPTDYVVPREETFTTATRRSFEFVTARIVERMQEGF